MTSYERLSLADYHWLLMAPNLRKISVITKMVGFFKSDDVLCAIECHSALFIFKYHNNHDTSKVEHSKEHGCFIACDTKIGKISRARSSPKKLFMLV